MGNGAVEEIAEVTSEELLLAGKYLPANMYWFRKRMEEMGISFGESNGDARFVSCALPKGWKVRKIALRPDQFSKGTRGKAPGFATRYGVLDEQGVMRVFALVYESKAEMWIP